MPDSRSTLERLTAVETLLKADEKYTHERWHKLNNDLQPILMLPEKMVRELGMLQGAFRGELEAAVKDFDKAMANALAPIIADIEKLKEDVVELKEANAKHDGAEGFVKAVLKSPFIGAFIGAMVTVIGAIIYYLKGGK